MLTARDDTAVDFKNLLPVPLRFQAGVSKLRVVAPAQALYYEKSEDVEKDTELQAWWTEIRKQGHADADPSAWPATCQDGIKTMEDLSMITTTMAWMGSAHHAAGESTR